MHFYFIILFNTWMKVTDSFLSIILEIMQIFKIHRIIGWKQMLTKLRDIFAINIFKLRNWGFFITFEYERVLFLRSYKQHWAFDKTGVGNNVYITIRILCPNFKQQWDEHISDCHLNTKGSMEFILYLTLACPFPLWTCWMVQWRKHDV